MTLGSSLNLFNRVQGQEKELCKNGIIYGNLKINKLRTESDQMV